MSKGFNNFLLCIDIKYYYKFKLIRCVEFHNKSLKLNGIKILLKILKLFKKRNIINKLGYIKYKLLKYSKYLYKWIVKISYKDHIYKLYNRCNIYLNKKLMHSFFINIKKKITRNRLLKFNLMYQKRRKMLISWFYFVDDRKFLKEVIYYKILIILYILHTNIYYLLSIIIIKCFYRKVK